jgi:flagellar hook-length control protein FliK
MVIQTANLVTSGSGSTPSVSAHSAGKATTDNDNPSVESAFSETLKEAQGEQWQREPTHTAQGKQAQARQDEAQQPGVPGGVSKRSENKPLNDKKIDTLQLTPAQEKLSIAGQNAEATATPMDSFIAMLVTPPAGQLNTPSVLENSGLSADLVGNKSLQAQLATPVQAATMPENPSESERVDNTGNVAAVMTASGQAFSAAMSEQERPVVGQDSSAATESQDLAVSTEQSTAIETDTPVLTASHTAPALVENKEKLPEIAKPITHPEWSKDLGQHIVWQLNKALPSAEISLNPEHLGPMTVRIDMNQDQATVQFTSAHEEVRQALEASIPKLRELLQTQNLSLADVNISQHPPQQQQHSQQALPNFNQQRNDSGLTTESESAVQDTPATEQVITSINRVLNLYA